MAGLNFVGNAAYADMKDGVENVAQFEFIPWILSQCATVSEAKEKLAVMNLVGTPFNPQLPAASASLDHRRQRRGDRCRVHERRTPCS